MPYSPVDYYEYSRHPMLETTTELIANGVIRLNIPSSSTGDMYYRAVAGELSRLPIGTVGRIMTSNGTLPTWAVPSFVPLARNITINGTTQDLSVDRTWSTGDYYTTFTATGDGVATSFTYTVTGAAPTWAVVTPLHPASGLYSYIELSGSNIIFWFDAPPGPEANNIKFFVHHRKT